MNIVLFCEQKYAISILNPLQEEAAKNQEHQILWYVHQKNIPEFPLDGHVKWTSSIQEIYDFHPEVIFIPCNIVPYYLPGIKIQIFHGYAAEKKDHWVIRRYFDLYFTQGPYFTKVFKALSRKYKDFEVFETGWTKQDWIYKHRHDFEENKKQLLAKHNKKQIVLYAPTFSPSLTSLPHLKESLRKLSHEKDIVLLLKFHPLTRQEWIEEYCELARQEEHILWIDDPDVTKYELMADFMISDTSSTIYEFLLLNKPVITYNTLSKDRYWLDISDAETLSEAFEQVQTEEWADKRQWIIDNYDPYLDGQVCKRMLTIAQNYVEKHGVPQKRNLNLWRQYTSIKKFGKIRKGIS